MKSSPMYCDTEIEREHHLGIDVLVAGSGAIHTVSL